MASRHLKTEFTKFLQTKFLRIQRNEKQNSFYLKTIFAGEFFQLYRLVFSGAPTLQAQELGATCTVSPYLSRHFFEKEIENAGGVHPYHRFFLPARFVGNRLETLDFDENDKPIWKIYNYRSA